MVIVTYKCPCAGKMYAYSHSCSYRQGGCVPEKHFWGSPPEEISPLILIKARCLFGESSVGGFSQSFYGAQTACLYEE
jgi:hypothetical protein